jgi:hypothetical protein
MGRTVPTFRQMIEFFGVEWNSFRHALRSEDQEMFDALLNHARRHAAAGHHFSHPHPFEPIVISMLLEHEKDLQRLRGKLDGISKGSSKDDGSTQGKQKEKSNKQVL